jgi:hypothetical protein
MEIEFRLVKLRITDTGEAVASIRVEPKGKRGMAYIDVITVVLIEQPPGAPGAPSLQAIGDAAIAQTRLLLHPENAQRFLQRWEEEEARRDVQMQTRGLGLG